MPYEFLVTPAIKIFWDIIKSKSEKNLESVFNREEAEKAFQAYAAKYQSRYGLLKLLGMSQAVQLESVYTPVKFLDKDSLRSFECLESLEKAYRNSKLRRFQTSATLSLRGECENKDGIEVANSNQYLMVLGGPGAGKTTFLRRVGLEALKKESSQFNHSCVPVILELKQFNKDEIDLTQAIVKELENFGFPPSKEVVTKALEEGKFLILLDGLDEVPESNFNAVCNSIDRFVTKFEKNRFIASCRLAAYKSSFQRFRDIELADFNDRQIEQFIHNWFQSDLDRQSHTASTCWSDLNEPGNQSAKELAQTPLLLTFLCLVYNRSLRFPSNRSELYQKALDILLEEWAAEKRVKYQPIAPELNVGVEKVLLSEIAYKNFARNRLFFPRQQLIDSIQDFLADTVDKPKYLDGQAILNAIVIQQGILVERAPNIFSFSHLTLQEYLTALYISKQRDRMEKLIKEHLGHRSWREIFLLVAGLVETDELLELIEKEIQIRQFIRTPKLKALLRWAEKATAGSEGDISPAGKRAIAYVYGYVYAYAYAFANTFAFVFANTNGNALTNANALAKALANTNANALAKALANTNVHANAKRQNQRFKTIYQIS